MSSFIVFPGPNGSGKSSVRDSIANPAEVVIDPDRIAREIDPADPRSVDRQAGAAAVLLFEECLAQGKSISMETTLTGHSAVIRMRALPICRARWRLPTRSSCSTTQVRRTGVSSKPRRGG